MFDLESYTNKLASNIDINNITDDIAGTRSQITGLIDVYSKSDLFDSRYKFKDKWVSRKMETLSDVLAPMGRNKSPIENITVLLGSIEPRLAWVESEVNKIKSKTIATNAITYPAAMLLAISGTLKFVVEYSRQFLLCVYAFETDAVPGKYDKKAFPYVKAELIRIENNFIRYTDSLKLLMVHSPDNMVKLYGDIPNVIINETTMALHGDVPSTFGFISYHHNPVYIIRRLITDYQLWRVESAEAEERAIELRIQKLKLKKLNNPDDPTIEDSIAVNENRLKGVTGKIRDLLKEYDLDE